MSQKTYEEIVYEVEEPVAVITMNRPANLNAFTTLMLAEVRHALAEAERDERVVGIVLTGAGRGFCAGMDMNALNTLSAAGGERAEEDLSHLDASPGNPDMGEDFAHIYDHLLGLRKPLIAAVNGAAAGLGMSYALLADLRFVEKTAKFTTAFSARGLVAEHGMSWTLPRLLGPAKALDILWTARRIGGEEAVAMGLGDRLCETGESVDDAKEYIRQLAATAAPLSLMIMKQQVYKHIDMPIGPAMEETTRLMDESLVRPDFREGVRSFMEKRPPKFDRVKVS